MIETVEYQLALFSANFNLGDSTVFIKNMEEVFDLKNATKNILPPASASGILPRIYIIQNDLEIHAGDNKINLIIKQNNEDSLTDEKFFEYVKRMFSRDYFAKNEINFSRVGLAVTKVKHLNEYGSFIKNVFKDKWANEAETFTSRTDYFFSTDLENDGYLIVNMQTVLNNQSKKGVMVQFDITTKEDKDINLAPIYPKLENKIKELYGSKYISDKIRQFEE